MGIEALAASSSSMPILGQAVLTKASNPLVLFNDTKSKVLATSISPVRPAFSMLFLSILARFMLYWPFFVLTSTPKFFALSEDSTFPLLLFLYFSLYSSMNLTVLVKGSTTKKGLFVLSSAPSGWNIPPPKYTCASTSLSTLTALPTSHPNICPFLFAKP